MNLLLFINKYFKKNYTSITIDDITNKKIQNIKLGHYDASPGLGISTTLDVLMTKETIIINKGECLSENSSKEKIKQIIKLFGI